MKENNYYHKEKNKESERLKTTRIEKPIQRAKEKQPLLIKRGQKCSQYKETGHDKRKCKKIPTKT